MLGKIRRKLILNKKINTVFVFIFFCLITFTSIGYSILQQNLMITGDINYEAPACSSFTNDSWETIVYNAQTGN